MLKNLLGLTCLAVATCACTDSSTEQKNSSIALSDLKTDEHVVFFQTSAWLDEDAMVWHLPIHGWVYEPEDSEVRKAVIAEVLDRQYDLRPGESTEANFSRRVNLLIADNERDKDLLIRLGDGDYLMPSSDPNGHFNTTIELSEDQVKRIANDGFVTYKATTNEPNPRVFSGTVELVAPEGISVISDIDDTIKVSEVTDHKKLFDYTFFRDFEAVPGMPQLYQQWSAQGASIHFVSSSPWQLYSPLTEFTGHAGFPAASFTLKSVRFRDETLLNLFKKGTETKPAQIEPILKTYAKRKFVLVGDSGEQDPEVYADLMRRYPDQIMRIYIRNVSAAERGNERFKTVFAGIAADRWHLFTDPKTLTLP